MDFEELQDTKVRLASELSRKLIDIRPLLSAAEQLEKHDIVVGWLERYVDALRKLLKLVKEQKRLCANLQCRVQLDEEIAELEGGKDYHGIIPHLDAIVKALKLNLKGSELDFSKVRGTLAMIASRVDSLNELRKAA